jgi:hypothetical protein
VLAACRCAGGRETPHVSTSAVSGGGKRYGGQFTYTFSAPSGMASGLEGGRINEMTITITPVSQGAAP